MYKNYVENKMYVQAGLQQCLDATKDKNNGNI